MKKILLAIVFIVGVIFAQPTDTTVEIAHEKEYDYGIMSVDKFLKI